MNTPRIAVEGFVDSLRPLLLETITIEQDTGSLTPPAGAPNWTAVHSSVAANLKPMTTDETRNQAHTIAATAYTVIADGWLSTVTTAMRVVYAGANYDILGVSRVGDLDLTRLVIERRAS